MKRLHIIVAIILTLAACVTVYAVTYSANDPGTFNNAYQWTGGAKDRATVWAQDIEALSQLGLMVGPDSAIWYVDSGAGTTGNGRSWTTAVLTIEEANVLSLADGGASRGDFILAAPGHNEGGTAAGIFDLDTIGITLIGIGNGSLKPTIDFDGASATCTIGADNVSIFNMRFRISSEDLPDGLIIESGADYALISGCEFGYAETSTDEWDTMLKVGTSTGTTIENCFFFAGAAETERAIEFDAATQLVVRNNRMYGDYATACIENAVTLSEYVLFENNLMWNGETGALNAQPVVEVLAGTVGICRNNDAVCNVATQNLAFVGTLLFNRGNSYNESQSGSYTAWVADLVVATTNMSILPSVGS